MSLACSVLFDVSFLGDDSALLITLNGKKDDHLDMLNSGIIYRLLEEKWKAFAKVGMLNSIEGTFAYAKKKVSLILHRLVELGNYVGEEKT